jgi:hypothetical protein
MSGHVYSSTVPEQVISWDPEVRWEPNAPAAVLISTDDGTTALALNPHPDDPDPRCVIFSWSGVAAAFMGAPNDEAISGHRLYDRGLKDLTWAGIVSNSKLIAALERQNRVHPMHDPTRFAHLTHHVLLLKENTVEVVADRVDAIRLEGPTLQAASTTLNA